MEAATMATVSTDSSKFISSTSSISSSADRNNRINLSTILFVQKVLNHFIDLGHMECSEQSKEIHPCLQCAEEKKYIHQYVKPCKDWRRLNLSKNPKYTIFTIKRSLRSHNKQQSVNQDNLLNGCDFTCILYHWTLSNNRSINQSINISRNKPINQSMVYFAWWHHIVFLLILF